MFTYVRSNSRSAQLTHGEEDGHEPSKDDRKYTYVQEDIQDIMKNNSRAPNIEIPEKKRKTKV